jgi:LysR family transcriptional regulator (chromosome initiation inhibitor)
MIPDAQAAPHRAAGTLIDLPDGPPVDVPLYWQQWKLDSPALAAVAEAVARAAATALHPPG